jgi:fumarate reductase subunit D
MDEQNQNQAPMSANAKDAAENKYTAALSYVWILFLIPLLTKKDSKFCQFHAKQGLILFIISLISWFPFFGWIIGLAVIVVAIIAILKVLSGEYWKIPYISEWAEKIKI